jgi:hypothetical protein
MVDVRMRLDDKAVRRMLADLPSKQIPFAISTGVNAISKRVAAAETAALGSEFHKATPFTKRAIAIQPARKEVPYAVVYVKDAQAAYLAPYETGGRQFLGSKRALINPKAKPLLNQYGNLPKGKLQRLKGRKDVFIGAVKTKAGLVSGVWQRLPGHIANAKDAKGEKVGPLVLLIRWGDPQEVKPTLHFATRAAKVASDSVVTEFQAAFAKALATAK